jgi:Fis family transcriptional regulator
MTADVRKLAAVRDSEAAEATPNFILSDHVRLAMRTYFARLDGHEVTNLYAMVLSEVEKPLIETVLEQCGHNQSKAAQILGLSRSTLRKKMTQYGIE